MSMRVKSGPWDEAQIISWLDHSVIPLRLASVGKHVVRNPTGIGAGQTVSWPRTASLRAELAELCAELVTNASRHGNARHIEIVVTGLDAETVQLVGIDDGVGPKTHPRVGAGLARVDRLGGSWEVARTDDGRTMVRLSVREVS